MYHKTMHYLKSCARKIVYINCSHLHYQLRVDGSYYHNFEVYNGLAWVIAFMIASINILCLVIITKQNSFRKPSDILLNCMVFCDLLNGIFSVPSWLISLLLAYHNYPNCTLYRFTVFCGYFVGRLSFLTIFLITLDRYVSISKPYVHVKWSVSKHIYNSILVFVFTVNLIGVSSLFLVESFNLQATVASSFILIILIVNVILYVKIGLKIKAIENCYRNLVGQIFATSNVTNHKKSQVIMSVMVIKILLSYAPYFLLQLLHFFRLLDNDLSYGVTFLFQSSH